MKRLAIALIVCAFPAFAQDAEQPNPTAMKALIGNLGFAAAACQGQTDGLARAAATAQSRATELERLLAVEKNGRASDKSDADKLLENVQQVRTASDQALEDMRSKYAKLIADHDALADQLRAAQTGK